MKFYEFRQNNSGGTFSVDNYLCHRLFIEAENPQKATEKAESLGVYFHGVAAGIDCPCCGDRWYRIDDDDAIEFPIRDYKDVEFNTIESYAHYLADKWGWTVPDIRIFYADGYTVEIFQSK